MFSNKMEQTKQTKILKSLIKKARKLIAEGEKEGVYDGEFLRIFIEKISRINIT